MDGDIAVQKEQTVLCLGLSSINANSLTGIPQKSPVGALKNGLGALPPLKTTSNLESQPGYNPQPGRSSALSDVKNRSKTNKVKETLDKIVIKRKQIWSGIGKKIRIALLNINGRQDEKKRDKWPKLMNLVRSKRTEMISKKIGKVVIINNGTSTSKEGVTFILNKQLVNRMKWKHTPTIEGRASRLEIETKQNRGMNIILIYAPNETRDKLKF